MKDVFVDASWLTIDAASRCCRLVLSAVNGCSRASLSRIVQQKNDSVVWLGQNDRHWRRMTSVQLEETRFQFLFVMLSDRLVAHIDVKTFFMFYFILVTFLRF